MNSRILYALGLPIQLMQQKSDVYFLPRKYIPANELIDAFSDTNLQSVKLFKTQEDAFKYCHRRGIHLRNGLSAIYKVEYSGSNENWLRENINVVTIEYDSYESHKSNGFQILASVQIEYIEVNRNEVIPLEAELQTKDPSRSDPNGIKILCSHNYSIQNQNTASTFFGRFCNII